MLEGARGEAGVGPRRPPAHGAPPTAVRPRVALAVTAREEARLLPAHLDYHRFIGVERAYVYLDDPGDETHGSVAHLAGVETRPSVEPDRFRGVPELGSYVEAWATHQTARQCLNAADALARAEEAGFDWLLSIDADELLCLDRRRTAPGALHRALAALPEEIAAVRARPLEVVQRMEVPGLVFRQARHFKRPGGPERAIRDPRDDTVACRVWFLGHGAGKSLVRLGRGAVPSTVHRFCGPGGQPLPTKALGEILHYHAFDPQDWLKKFRIHPRHRRYASGQPIEPQKLLWMELVDELDDAALREYYRSTIAFAPEQLRPLTRRHWSQPWRSPPIVEVRAIADAFASQPELRSY